MTANFYQRKSQHVLSSYILLLLRVLKCAIAYLTNFKRVFYNAHINALTEKSSIIYCFSGVFMDGPTLTSSLYIRIIPHSHDSDFDSDCRTHIINCCISIK